MTKFEAAKQVYVEFGYAAVGWSYELEIGTRILPTGQHPFIDETAQPFVVIRELRWEEANKWLARFNSLANEIGRPWPAYVNHIYAAVTE